MNIADRIQNLRKSKGFSQEELADKINVSRQAVSKWESEQSMPDIEKIIALSEIFAVTTDYILKGVEPEIDQNKKSGQTTSKVLYIASTAFIAIGLFCAFGGWYESQTMQAVWGGMMIQAVGVAGYFIARALSSQKASFYVNYFNIIGAIFIPVSMLTGYLSIIIFKQGLVSPYPNGVVHTFVFFVVFLIIAAISFVVLKKKTE